MINLNGKIFCESCFAEIPAGYSDCPYCSSERNSKKYPTALPEGTILTGRYVVGRVLGKGGFGVTYLCYDTREGKTVAIKEYLPDHLTHRNTGETVVSTYSGDAEEYFKTGIQKFFEEAKLVSNFNGNPNIISVYELFYENNTTYFVMEYLDGVDLKTYIAEHGGKISEEEALYIAERVVQALMIVHSTNILHRDIAPDNIFICKDGKVKLIDFGAARQVMGEVSKSLSVVLKEGFAPYEQYSTKGKQGPWTDIYALGATLYYALTGEKPDTAMDRLAGGGQLNLQNASPEFAEIITKMVEVKPEDRYQNVIELKKDMSRIGENSLPPPPISVEPWYKKFLEKTKKIASDIDAKTKKRIIAVTAAVALVLIAVFVISGINNGSDFPGNDVIAVNESTQRYVASSRQGIISAGDSFTVAIKEDGKVVATGDNDNKQCNVSDWANIVEVSAGISHTVALKSDGTVVAVGGNSNGKCNVSEWTDIIAVDAGENCTVGLKSDGTVVATRSGKSHVSKWKNIVAVSAGKDHIVGLKSDGTVIASGDNDDKQCDVSDWENIVDISAGDNWTVGLKSDGTVVVTGDNYYGQCDVSEWKDIIAIDAGQVHTVGLTSDGTVVLTGLKPDKEYKIIDTWTDIIAVSAGYFHTVGLKSDGTVVAAGYNNDNECDVWGWGWKIIRTVKTSNFFKEDQLGFKPVSIATRNDVISANVSHTLAIRDDGTVVATGDNDDKQCNVSGWKDLVSVSAGYSHSVGLRKDGTVVATGENYQGCLDVSDWTDIIDVSTCIDHTVGLKSNGTVVAVGDNRGGCCDVSKWKNIVDVSAGDEWTVGLKSDGTVVAAGINERKCLNVDEWRDIVAVSTGMSHTVGLKSDGTVVATGDNDLGQCNVSTWTNIVAIAVGNCHTVGLRADGTMIAAGEEYNSACDVSEWKNIVAIAANGAHTLGVKSDGTVITAGIGYNNIPEGVSGWKNIKIPE